MAGGIELKLMVAIILGCLTTDANCKGTFRLCGKELADALALVCQGRGYNVAFKPQDTATTTTLRRYKRGIVDECCRRVCALSTLESYCSEALPTKKDTLQISKRSELSSSEMHTTVPMENRLDNKQLFDNSIRSTKNRKLRPLVLLYANGYRPQHPTDKFPNLNINTVKSTKKAAANIKQENQGFHGILMNGYNPKNEPLDTSEIMAEVVESNPESNFKRKQSLLAKLAQV